MENISSLKKHLYLAPLITECSIHNNCGGQFNNFYKKDGIGHWVVRMKMHLIELKKINLEIPLFTPLGM